MSANDLFQQGIAAIRDEKDLAKARNLLTQALRLDPDNDDAWVWLSRTVGDVNKRKQCLQRALMLNPQNEQAKAILERIAKGQITTTSEMAVAAAQQARKLAEMPAVPPSQKSSLQLKADARKGLNPAQQQQINALLAKAQSALDKENTEAAIEQWVRVLEIEPDHEVALSNAVRYLSRLKFMDDAKELVWNALKSGTEHPSVYLTAIDIARRDNNHEELDNLKEKLALLPAASESIVAEQIDYFLDIHQLERAERILRKVVEIYPKNQKLLLQMGNVLEDLHRHKEAIPYFERAAKRGVRSREGKTAEQKLDTFAPALTDKERGSVWQAVRETFGIGVFVLVLAWLDSGLNFLQMGARWAGVILSLAGGYLVITALSSPQQQPLARILGGQIPEAEAPEKDEYGNVIIKESTHIPIIPIGIRAFLGMVGFIILGVSVYLVFNRTIQLLGNPHPPPFDLLTYDQWVALALRR